MAQTSASSVGYPDQILHDAGLSPLAAGLLEAYTASRGARDTGRENGVERLPLRGRRWNQHLSRLSWAESSVRPRRRGQLRGVARLAERRGPAAEERQKDRSEERRVGEEGRS